MDTLYKGKKHFLSFHLSTNFLLFLIVLAGSILRLKDLTFQGLWLDEIHTVIEADPTITLADILYFMRNTDPHPPLYFFGIHYWFKLVGYNDFTARLFSVIAGVASILSMYCLGKELRNKNVGLIAAALIAFNFYSIFYSQEARNYIFALLFSTISFLYFIRALKKPTPLTGLAYALATILLLYTHYYSVFIVMAQIVTVLVFLLITKQYKDYFRCFGTATLVALLLYAPWLPTLLKIGDTPSFWIAPPSPDFFILFFKEYFYHYYFIIYINYALLAVFIGGVVAFLIKHKFSTSIPFSENLPAIALLLFIWVLVSYGVPYVRSLMATPMLFPRYTIVTLPAILLAIALGIDLLRWNAVKIALVVTMCVFMVVNLVYAKNFYQTKTKQEWREMALFIAKNNAAQYPILSDRGWYLPYYFKKFDSPLPLKAMSVSNLLSPETKGVWVATENSGNPMTPEIKKALDEHFVVQEEFTGLGVWASLYVKSSGQPGIKSLTFTGGENFQNEYRVLWANGKFTSQQIDLSSGTYDLLVGGYGTIAENTYAMVTIYKNQVKIGSQEIANFKNYPFRFIQETAEPVTFTLEFTNDVSLPNGDRNFYLKSLKIRPVK